MNRLFTLLFTVFLVSSCHTKPNGEEAENVYIEKEVVESPFIHSVYFWFKDEVTPEQVADFAEASMKLKAIDGVIDVYDGTPAATDRPIVEKSYDYALIVVMKDLATHDAYQQDSIHLKLLEDYADLWERVMVTDID